MTPNADFERRPCPSLVVKDEDKDKGELTKELTRLIENHKWKKPRRKHVSKKGRTNYSNTVSGDRMLDVVRILFPELSNPRVQLNRYNKAWPNFERHRDSANAGSSQMIYWGDYEGVK